MNTYVQRIRAAEAHSPAGHSKEVAAFPHEDDQAETMKVSLHEFLTIHPAYDRISGRIEFQWRKSVEDQESTDWSCSSYDDYSNGIPSGALFLLGCGGG